MKQPTTITEGHPAGLPEESKKAPKRESLREILGDDLWGMLWLYEVKTLADGSNSGSSADRPIALVRHAKVATLIEKELTEEILDLRASGQLEQLNKIAISSSRNDLGDRPPLPERMKDAFKRIRKALLTDLSSEARAAAVELERFPVELRALIKTFELENFYFRSIARYALQKNNYISFLAQLAIVNRDRLARLYSTQRGINTPIFRDLVVAHQYIDEVLRLCAQCEDLLAATAPPTSMKKREREISALKELLERLETKTEPMPPGIRQGIREDLRTLSIELIAKARHASAQSTSTAPAFGVFAAFPQLSDEQLRAAAEHGRAHQWDARRDRGLPWKKDVFEYVYETFQKWIPGLTLAHLKHIDLSLYRRVTREISLRGKPYWFDVPPEHEARDRIDPDPRRVKMREHGREAMKLHRAIKRSDPK